MTKRADVPPVQAERAGDRGLLNAFFQLRDYARRALPVPDLPVPDLQDVAIIAFGVGFLIGVAV